VFVSAGESEKFTGPFPTVQSLSIPMTIRLFLPGLAALLALAAAAGCGGDAPSLSSELDDSSYRYGQQLEHQGNWDEALTAYLKVIDRRGDGAPESNLNAGLIYLNHIRDPISAIYHFRRYLELEPNSKQAVFVKGMIDSAKREFARSLPGQPLENESEHLGMEEQVERLQREVDELKAENTALRAGASVPVTHSSTIDLSSIPTPKSAAEEAPAPAAPPPLTAAPEGAGVVAAVPAITDAPEENAPAPAKEAKPAAAARHHTVVKGDTLFNLALKYYGNRSRWRDIFAANRDVLSSENSPLKIGVEIKIP
jgi:tetratricopeptide (TPR) repeat protein